jgi:transposase-like protein
MAKEPEGRSEIERNAEAEFVGDEEELAEAEGPEVAVFQDHPVCPGCGWSNTRLSHHLSTLDSVLQLISIQVFRCRSCNRRFHKFQRRG